MRLTSFRRTELDGGVAARRGLSDFAGTSGSARHLCHAPLYLGWMVVSTCQSGFLIFSHICTKTFLLCS
jgi:hypothetical protein